MVRKWALLFALVVILLAPLSVYAEEDNTVIVSTPESSSVGSGSIEEHETNVTAGVAPSTSADNEPAEEYKADAVALPSIPEDGKSVEENKINTADVFLDIVSADGEPIEMDIEIEYYRYGLEGDFILNVDEAGDRALGTVLIAYRMAGKKISSATLRSGEGVLLLKEKAWAILAHFNNFPYEPVKIVGVNVDNMTFNPDPESLGRPTIFFIGEESGDAKAGI